MFVHQQAVIKNMQHSPALDKDDTQTNLLFSHPDWEIVKLYALQFLIFKISLFCFPKISI